MVALVRAKLRLPRMKLGRLILEFDEGEGERTRDSGGLSLRFLLARSRSVLSRLRRVARRGRVDWRTDWRDSSSAVVSVAGEPPSPTGVATCSGFAEFLLSVGVATSSGFVQVLLSIGASSVWDIIEWLLVRACAESRTAEAATGETALPAWPPRPRPRTEPPFPRPLALPLPPRPLPFVLVGESICML